jgi:hypothetical protein
MIKSMSQPETYSRMIQPRQQALFAGLLVTVAILSRIVFNELQIFNFSAVMSAALFGGAFLVRRTWKYAIPMVVMLATDAVLGVYNLGIMLSVYGALLFTVLLGDLYTRKPSMGRYAGSVIAGSLSFFVVTNFAVWFFGDGTMYPHTGQGLVQSFSMAIPFYRNTLLSDLLFSSAFYGAFELFRMKQASRYRVAA